MGGHNQTVLSLQDGRCNGDSLKKGRIPDVPSVPRGWVEGSRRSDQGCRSSPGGGPQDDHQAKGRAVKGRPEDRSGDIEERAQESKSQGYRGLGMGALWDRDQAMRHGEL
ncbi:hypothetical protein EYF80_042349 [Liparis tanakae]|uniref:Uncharacterized protein n=1 Tax=Liparis tanakae TaxID=230148 RepID=A0A4Z2G3T4_9TELE|nr:hypothetical protein EYF80_042349 [Liparis tanakae]